MRAARHCDDAFERSALWGGAAAGCCAVSERSQAMLLCGNQPGAGVVQEGDENLQC
jgi:hypothetical protein